MIKFNAPYIPESVGFDSARLDALHRFFQRQMDKNVIMGASYALARDGKLFAAASLGKLCYREDDDRPLAPDSIFGTASVTKLFTAVSVFLLIEDGLCRLDEAMSMHIPEMDTEEFRSVSIAQVLSHTGGLPTTDWCLPDDPDSWEDKAFDRIGKELEEGGRDWISAALRGVRANDPGKYWGYSSIGFMLLGELVGRLSGMRAERFIEQNILIPCGMTDSGFGETMIKCPDFKKRVFIQSERSEKHLDETPKEDDPWLIIPATGGGLFSTVLDLMKFGNMLLSGGRIDGRRVMGRKSVERMTTRYTKPHVSVQGQDRWYGLGADLTFQDCFLDSPGTYYHEGWGRCGIHIDPVERLVTVIHTPVVDTGWDSVPVYNPHSIINSGLM